MEFTDLIKERCSNDGLAILKTKHMKETALTQFIIYSIDKRIEEAEKGRNNVKVLNVLRNQRNEAISLLDTERGDITGAFYSANYLGEGREYEAMEVAKLFFESEYTQYKAEDKTSTT